MMPMQVTRLDPYQGGPVNTHPTRTPRRLVLAAFGLIILTTASVFAAENVSRENAHLLAELRAWSTGSIPVLSLAFSPEGDTLYGTLGNQIAVWDPRDGTLFRQWAAHPSYAPALAVSPGGGLLATAGDDATVRIWNAASGDLLRSLTPAGTHSVAFSPDGRLLASGSLDGTLRVWDVETGALQRRVSTSSGIFTVAFSPDSMTIASAHGIPDFAVRVWSVESGALLWEGFEHSADVHVVAFAPGGGVLASAGADALVSVWDAATGERVHALREHRQPLFEAGFLSDTILATSDGSGATHLWDVEAGRSLKTLTAHRGQASGLAVAPGAAGLATASFDMRLILWGICEP